MANKQIVWRDLARRSGAGKIGRRGLEGFALKPS